MVFIMLCSLSTYFAKSFDHKLDDGILSNAFSVSIEMIIWFFDFAFVHVVYGVDGFAYDEPSL